MFAVLFSAHDVDRDAFVYSDASTFVNNLVCALKHEFVANKHYNTQFVHHWYTHSKVINYYEQTNNCWPIILYESHKEVLLKVWINKQTLL